MGSNYARRHPQSATPPGRSDEAARSLDALRRRGSLFRERMAPPPGTVRRLPAWSECVVILSPIEC